MQATHFKKDTLLASGAVILSAFLLIALMGFSSGYGKIVDGELVFQRRSLLSHMLQDFRRDGGEWSFGYFVPFAVAVLFWMRRKELLRAPVSPDLSIGGLILVFGMGVYWAGYRGEQKYFGYAACQIMILGGLFWFLGRTWVKQLFWLWVLLGLMWPWRFLIGRISAPLQMMMVKLTSSFMNLIGVDAVASGSSLSTASTDPVTSLPISLDVDVACSGMRSLFALMMIGLVFAFLRVSSEWKRWILILFVPAVAIVGNFVRLLMLYFGSVIWGVEFAVGENHEMSAFHMFAGLMVFVVALLLMSLLVGILEGGWKKVFARKLSTTRTVNQA